ncbi:MAG: glucose-6-phosphate 1-dehydrogenase, partial [Parcubacteria group bacterium Gr01-1014_33]
MLTAYQPKRNPKKEEQFLAMFRYVRGFFDNEGAYADLVTPDHYETVLTNIARSGLAGKNARDRGRTPLEVGRPGRPPSRERDGLLTGWTRIIVEKPFGKDADTAQHLDTLLGELFAEEQIYRRGGFYDGVGALRDVGQNHLLQMLALVTMDRPYNFGSPALRQRRVEALNGLRVPTAREITDTSVRAQYEGYRAIRGVSPDSTTETYFKIGASFVSPRWRGVAVTMESGKRMGTAQKEIEITFRHPQPCLCPPDAGMHYRNRMVISLEPEERIVIHFWSKKPGFAYALEERTLAFVLRQSKKKSPYVEEYKKLLLDCITGDQTLFVSTEEVKAMWRFIDPISDAWRENKVPLLSYAP